MSIVVLIALVIYGGMCYSLASSYLRPNRVVSVVSPGLKETAIPTTYGPDPTFATDNLANPEKSVVFVFVHGYGGGRDNFSDLMRDLAKHGYGSIAPSMNGQDASPDPSVSFGVRESRTVLDVVKWVHATALKPVKVVVVGLSLGGGAVWLAAQDGTGIDGVITEGAYARFDEAMNRFFDRNMPFGSIVLKPVIWFARLKSGINPSAIVPMNAAKSWHGKPALVIQAENDNLINLSHAQRLSEAAGCPLWIVPGASHAHCYDIDPKEYVERIVTFADHLAPGSQRSS